MTPTKMLKLLALGATLSGFVATSSPAERMDKPMPMAKFDEMDTDKDGKITAEEFASFRAAEFAKADTNADGQLASDELAAKHLAQMSARAADMAAKMIDRMDENGDGQLSAEELDRGPRAPGIFGRMDADGDGVISKAEAEAMKDKMDHRHRSFDSNG